MLNSLYLKDGNGQNYASSLPRDILTGTGVIPRPRLRVDVGQTGFFEGREFRAFYEFNIAAGATLVGRFICPVDFILFNQSTTIVSGTIRETAVVGAVEGGSWTPVTPIGKNRMADRPLPLYVGQATLSTGGTSTGGTVTDVQIVSAVQTGNNAGSVGSQADDARGLPAGTYHLRFQNTSNEASVGVFALAWEERQPSSLIITT